MAKKIVLPKFLLFSAIIILMTGKPVMAVLALEIPKAGIIYGYLENNNLAAGLKEPILQDIIAWTWPFIPCILPAAWLQFMEKLSQQHPADDRVKAAEKINERGQIEYKKQTANKDLKAEEACAENQLEKRSDKGLEMQLVTQEPITKEAAQTEKRKWPISSYLFCPVEDMGLLFCPGYSPNRAVAQADHTTGALGRVNGHFIKSRTYTRWALLVDDMLLVFLAKILQGCQDRIRGTLAEGTQRALDHSRPRLNIYRNLFLPGVKRSVRFLTLFGLSAASRPLSTGFSSI